MKVANDCVLHSILLFFWTLYISYEGHMIGWDEVEILQIETKSRHRKLKESAHMACMINLTTQPTLELTDHMDSTN